MLYEYDEWKTTPPEDVPIGHCENCGEVLYDDKYVGFCSEECVTEFFDLKIIKEEKYCECCGEGLTGWEGYLIDLDNNLYCDIECFLKSAI
ncbi:YgiT-type zinc finger protein [Romboutsia ilealis]|uniref:YgiT-type zinc finger protein n=1 Tax=Romboutsia ilealis TaxID=1115758 RepID=UPI0026F38F45|nr:YgiT-type zinc finger protein [Romboutsia ilealis]